MLWQLLRFVELGWQGHMTSAFALWMRALALASGLLGAGDGEDLSILLDRVGPQVIGHDSSGRGMEAQTMQP